MSNWYTEGDLPDTWAIKPTSNGWTDNETGLDWLRHFDKHTRARTKGVYRMLVLDGHESHQSVAFENYCKEHNIITICLPPHSSHITQPLDVGFFSPLKRAYGRQIELFIKAHINHITKVEFFLAYHAAYKAAMTKSNIDGGFRGLVLTQKPRFPSWILNYGRRHLAPLLAMLTHGSPRRHATRPKPIPRVCLFKIRLIIIKV